MMSFFVKKSLFTLIFNFSLFLILMIGIQNSYIKKKVNLIIGETVNLPVGFIVGISFIGGSITASLLETYIRKKDS